MNSAISCLMQVETISEHLGVIRRIYSYQNLRSWEKTEIDDIFSRRKSLNDDEKIILVNSILSMVNSVIDDKFLISARMRSRYLGGDLTVKLSSPKFINESDWSYSLLESFIRDWSGFVVVESIFSKEFCKKISNPRTHKAEFIKFISDKSLNRYIPPSRSCIKWCQNNLDGKWKYRKYGSSITREVLKKLPKLLTWSNIYISKRSGFGQKECFDNINYMVSLLKKDDNEQSQKEVFSFINSMLRMKETDSSFGQSNIYHQDEVKYSNGIDGIISHQFMELYKINPNICFMHIIRFYLENDRKTFSGEGYPLNSILTKPAISSIKRQRTPLKSNPIEIRKTFWNTIVNDFHNVSDMPFIGVIPKCKNEILLSSKASRILYEFMSLSREQLENPLALADNDLVKYACIGYLRKKVSVYSRRKYIHNLERHSFNISSIFSSELSKRIFKSKIDANDISIIISKMKDMCLSGRMPELINYYRADGLQDCYLLMKIIDCFIKSMGNIYNADSAIQCGTSISGSDNDIQTKKDILSVKPAFDQWTQIYSKSLNLQVYSHKKFVEKHSHIIYENTSLKKIRYGMLYGGMANINFWHEWNKIYNKQDYIDHGLAYFIFIGRMQLWDTYVARSLIGYDTDGKLWLPSVETMGRKPYKRQRLDIYESNY